MQRLPHTAAFSLDVHTARVASRGNPRGLLCEVGLSILAGDRRAPRSCLETQMALGRRRRIGISRNSIPLGVELDRRAREVLISARLAANLTQQELAFRLG